jgi:hypothetical protein
MSGVEGWERDRGGHGIDVKRWDDCPSDPNEAENENFFRLSLSQGND